MTKSSKIYMPIKRLLDILLSFLGILLMIAFVWWWVFFINLFSSKGKPIFCSIRAGKNDKPVKVIKFRSLKLNTDPNLSSFELNEESNATRFGLFLRKTSLDESLQLFNIFIGQMSIIGPRPLIDCGTDKITLEIRRKNGASTLRPGLSGYAQVNGRINVSATDKGNLDGYYFTNISFKLDVKIFMKTFVNVLKQKDVEK